MRDVQVLAGKLQFVSQCVKPGRLFISRILDFLRDFNGLKPRAKLAIPQEVRKDLFWWARFMEQYNGVSCVPESDWSQPDLVFATDACPVGGGGVCGDQYFHVAFPEPVVNAAGHINSLELLTIVLALKLWGSSLVGKKVLIFCDNSASVLALNSGKVQDPFMRQCLREIVYLCAIFQCEINAVHIAGVDNRLPDLLSRWEIHPKFREQFFKLTEHLSMSERVVDRSFFEWSCDW